LQTLPLWITSLNLKSTTAMRKIVLVCFVLVLWAGYCTAQIQLPDTATLRGALLGPAQFASIALKNAPAGKLDKWYSLPSPSDEKVTEVSIACDNSEMVIFYREPDYSLNLDKGPVKKWNGRGWDGFAGATNQCHYPDIDIADGIVVATWYDDSYDYGYGTNINGPWVSMFGTYLNKQWYPRASMAMGLPYMSFICRYSDGMPSSYLMLHVKHIVGPGDDIELNGGWRFIYNDVGMKTDITGDENAWYCVYSQQGYLLVDKGSIEDGASVYTDLGDGFRMGADATAHNPEIVLSSGMPVVAWLENSGTEVYIAKWNGEWELIGSATLTEGSASRIRMESKSTQFSSTLYVMYTIDNAENNISLNSFDGSNWYTYPSVQDVSNSTISSADIALYKGEPVVAYTQDGKLRVKVYSGDNPISGEIEISGKQEIKCYPNPMNEYFTVDLGRSYSGLRYDIVSITGTRMVRKEVGSAASIRGSLDAPPGLYLVEVFSENRRIARLKVIKSAHRGE